MWFIFPQLKGLGHSAIAQRYAIADLGEAKRYLADPVLGGRLRECVAAVLKHPNRTVHEIFGSPERAVRKSDLDRRNQATKCSLFDESLF